MISKFAAESAAAGYGPPPRASPWVPSVFDAKWLPPPLLQRIQRAGWAPICPQLNLRGPWPGRGVIFKRAVAQHCVGPHTHSTLSPPQAREGAVRRDGRVIMIAICCSRSITGCGHLELTVASPGRRYMAPWGVRRPLAQVLGLFMGHGCAARADRGLEGLSRRH